MPKRERANGSAALVDYIQKSRDAAKNLSAS
jgi:hypothetical protein